MIINEVYIIKSSGKYEGVLWLFFCGSEGNE